MGKEETMKHFSFRQQETLVYLVLWTALFIGPALSFYIQHSSSTAEGDFPWFQLLEMWRQFAILLVAFLIHHFFLAPLIVYKQRYLRYFSLVLVLMGAFVAYQCTDRPEPRHNDRAFTEHRRPADMKDEHRPPMGMRDEHLPPMPDGEGIGEPPADRPPHDRMRPPHLARQHRPPYFSEHDAVFTIMLFFMLGMNIGVKLFFRHREDQRRMALLEKENLEQQLEYLRYQINPHFLMNTLNNIHALVDIDQERAKETIVELSHIMRFALYDGSKTTVPLRLDIGFLESYIRLMRMRYTDKVTINFDVPQELPQCELPPMIFITFVENAFKHGVSYQQPSFIDIAFTTEGQQLRFTCRNSIAPKKSESEQEKGGVGLKNVQRRLDLIYGKRYTLNIENTDHTYNIELIIPLS